MERETRIIEDCGAELEARFGADVLCDVVALDEDRDLWPEERAIVALATDERRREFAAGRSRARELLGRLGFAPVPILRMGDRTPLWPRGAIGSIAHSRELCAVAVARTGRLASLGVDTEPDEPLEEELWETVCTRRELSSLAEWPREQRGRAARIYFSAKESTYKCLYPLTRRELELHDVEIELDERDGSFHASVNVAPSGDESASLDPGRYESANRAASRRETMRDGSVRRSSRARAGAPSGAPSERYSAALSGAPSALHAAELCGFCLVRAGSIFTGAALPACER